MLIQVTEQELALIQMALGYFAPTTTTPDQVIALAKREPVNQAQAIAAFAVEHPAIEEARRIYADDDLEIDDQPMISEADEGTWVSAWVWVANDG